MLPLFAPTELPAPLTTYDPAMALPDFAARVEKLRRWQQSIASGYVTTQKEEALQAEFLNLVFGQVLGYEHERPDYRQLLLEKKTNVDGTKPDGALGQFAADPRGALGGPVRAVVELKDARTLLDAKQKLGAKGRAETPVEQAFSYPSKMGASCRWVLVSNFVELRLYAANDQTRAEVFDFRTLPDQPAPLRRFFALLAAGQLLPLPTQPDAPLDLALRQRQEQEARISKDFYRDYRAARRDLLDHLIEQNPAVAPPELLGHAQKLLDRVIFVCFCEDKNIIPRLTFRRLLDAVRANVFDPADDKIYRTVRGLFRSIDQGNPAANINRFNGGLFAPDAALDALVIKDRTLEPVISLERYDFASELNVNILGHIFEQSLADLEAERARLAGEAPLPAKQGKRKQDGIFYTPDYITRYIVGQAVGGWLRERRQEAGLDALPPLTDADRASIGVNQQTKRLLAPSKNVQRHLAAWEAYGQRLRGIRVLDPACGSGAFLNEAFGYLLREGQVVNEELAELRAGQRELFDLDRHILQHNLYGVDLNPESVQITRLSLWLQTANPGRPLTSLDHSIRCGNSLIADPAVAGDRAFNWQTAFPEVFDNGGFDVVVGNPPYGAKVPAQVLQFFESEYSTFEYQANTYVFFYEQAFRLLRDNSYLSFITPATFAYQYYFKKLRHLIASYYIVSSCKYEYEVFEDASIGDCLTLVIKKNPSNSSIIKLAVLQTQPENGEVKHTEVNALDFVNVDEIFSISGPGNFLLTQDKTIKLLGDLANITVGIKPYQVGKGVPKQTREIVDCKPFNSDFQIDESFNRCFIGKNFHRYQFLPSERLFLKYGKWLAEPREDAPFFNDEKIIIRQTADSLICQLENTQAITLNNVYNIGDLKASLFPKYLLTILNSRFLNYIYQGISQEKGRVFAEVKKVYLIKLPIKLIPPAEQQPFIDLADQLLTGHRALHAADAAFATLLRAELGLAAPLTGKLAMGQEWKPWSTALQKALGRPLTLAEKGEWLPHYTLHQQQQAAARQHLAQLDARLDQLVYQLYQLTPAEIALVEGRTA